MIWTIALALSLAAGWFLARFLCAGAFAGPRWAALLIEVSLAALFGPGLASILYFGLADAAHATAAGVFTALGILTAGCAALWWTLPSQTASDPAPVKKFRWAGVLWICAAVGLLFLLLNFYTASSANPGGEWDAMAIWNVRARFLASGELWRRAVTAQFGGQMVGAAHPGYPLFLSAFVALQWVGGGTFDAMIPIAASLLFALGAFFLLGSSLASGKSTSAGLLGWLVLLASDVFVSQAASQYSDLLQGFAFLAALVLLDAAARRDSSNGGFARILIAAGLACGLAGWIKNEGLPFAIAALCVAAWRFRWRGIPWLALGAAPGLLATAILKLFVAQGSEAVFSDTAGQAVAKIESVGRWWQAALGFGKAVYDAGAPWSHPVLLLAVLALALGFIPAAERRARLWLWIPIAVAAAAEYAAYLITTADLDWHISTSVGRLVAQLWPALIWLCLWMLRTPEECSEAAAIPAKAAAAVPSSKRKSRR